MSSKKGRKKKGTTLALSDFLQLDAGGSGKVVAITKTADSWADSRDSFASRGEKLVVLPTAPSSVRGGAHVDLDRVPTAPPFKAFIGNISYDASEEALRDLFADLSVVDVHLPKDTSGRFRGYGYIEFTTRDDLVEALQMENLQMCGRTIRIDVKTQSDRDQQRGGFGSYSRDEGGSSDSADWRSGPRPSDTMSRYGSSDNYQQSSNSSMGRNRPGTSFSDFSRERRDDYQSPRYEDRGSSGYNSFRDRGSRYEDGGSRYESRGSRYDSGRADDGGSWRSSTEQRTYDAPVAGDRRDADDDMDWRRGPRREPVGDQRTPSAAASSSGPADDGPVVDYKPPSRTRPKLQLQPRTVPLDATRTESCSSQSSIFGQARPVDTNSRELDIEQRLTRVSVTGRSDEGATRRPAAAAPRGRHDAKQNGGHSSNGRSDKPLHQVEEAAPDFVEPSRFSALDEEDDN